MAYLESLDESVVTVVTMPTNAEFKGIHVVTTTSSSVVAQERDVVTDEEGNELALALQAFAELEGLV